MPSLKELREKAGQIVAEMKQIRDAYNAAKDAGKTGDDLWGENTQKRWDELNTQHDELRTQIDQETRGEELDQRLAEMERRFGRGNGDDGLPRVPGDPDGNPGGQTRDRETPEELLEQRNLAFQAWAGRRSQECRSEAHLAAAQRFGVDPNANELVLNLYDTRELGLMQAEYRHAHPSLVERRAMSGLQGSGGGFLVGSTMVNALEVNMLAYGSVERHAQVIVTQTGDEMTWPTGDDTSNEGEIVGENPSSANTADPSIAAVKMNAYTFSSKLVKVPVSLLQDAPGFLAVTLGQMLGERLGRAKNRKFATGTGANQPKGIITAATLGYTAASATAIVADEIIRLEHSVDPAYRNEPGAGYMAHDNIVLALRLLKDGEGRYMWSSGLVDGKPDRLNGRPFDVNQHMDSAMAASNKTLLFGALNKYKVRRVRQLRLRRLTERFAETDQEGFIAFERADGNLLDAGTAPVKYLQQASS